MILPSFRPGLQQFLLSLHQDDGGFIMHKDGELDIRLRPVLLNKRA